MAPSDARRDRWGRYLVVPPEGGRPLGYTRATTVAKVLDDGGGLIPWKAAVAMTGMMRRPGLRGRFEALLSQYPETGPWYGSPESKTAVKELVEECAEAGGSSDRADLGTALHAIVEQLNRGGTPTISQDSTRADVAAYVETIARAGIVFDPEYVEATVVLDKYKVAGTADGGVLEVPGLGRVVGDLKTGTNLDYSWQAIAVQLAIYARGDARYRQGLNPSGADDVRLPAADVRTDVAVVIHLPAGEARCDLYVINIAAGWEAFEHSVWARQWRSRKDLAGPFIPAATPASAAEETAALDAARLVLLDLVRSLPVERQQVIRDSWPSTLPSLKRPEHWTPALLSEATRFVGAAAGEPEQASPGVAERDAAAPGEETDVVAAWNALDDDERAQRVASGHLPEQLRVPVEQLAQWKATVGGLDDDVKRWVIAQAQAAGLPNLGHPQFWTLDRGAVLTAILDEAAQHQTAGSVPVCGPYDWTSLVEAAGLTKAAVQRQAKAIGEELGVKVGASIGTLPTEGPVADRLAEWVTEQGAQKATAA